MSKRNRLKLNRMKYTARRYVFSGRYVVRNALAVMIAATVIALVVVVLNLPGTKKEDPYAASDLSETASSTPEPGVVDPADQKETLVLYQVSMIDDIGCDDLSKVIQDEQQVQVTAKDVQVLANTKFNMDGKFLTERDAVNIRAEADQNAEILGRLYAGGTGEVIEKNGEWVKISSGGVVGYVYSNLILTDAAAAEKVEQYKASFAIVRDKVRVRVYGNADSDVYYVARVGEFFTVDKDNSSEEWTCVRLADGSYAFVASDYVSISEGLAEAVSMDDIDELRQAKAEYQDLLKAEEKAKAEAEKEKKEAEAKAKQAARVAAAASTEATTQAPSSTSAPVVTQEKSVTTTVDDLYLLAAIVYAESGSECYDAQLAVANVVMNRVRSGNYPNTISEVIYQPYQFTACKTRNFARALSTGGSSSSLRAAQEAMAGVNNVGGCIGFKFPNAVDKSKVSYYVQYGKIMFFQ